MTRKFNKQKSLEVGEVVLENTNDEQMLAWSDVQEDQEFTKREQPPETELTPADIKFAKANLKGTPHAFDEASMAILERLTRHGIAADFGSEGFGRGFKWHTI